MILHSIAHLVVFKDVAPELELSRTSLANLLIKTNRCSVGLRS
jgi:hypothetical protein